MDIEGIMIKKKATVGPNDTIEKALNAMEESYINFTPVVKKNGNLVGVIEKTDIYRFLMDSGHYKICPVDWVMTKSNITANKEEDILIVAKRLREKNVSALPVVEGENVVGIVTLENIIDYLVEKLQ